MWTIQRAITLLAKGDRTAHQAGFALALYGSVSRNGIGRDLDIAALPWRLDADPQALVDGLKSAWNLIEHQHAEGIMGTLSYILYWPDGSGDYIDLVIREAERLGKPMYPTGIFALLNPVKAEVKNPR